MSKKRIVRIAATGILSLLLLTALCILHSHCESNMLLVSCESKTAAELIGKMDCISAVYLFHEEKNAVISTPWRNITTPVIWISGDFVPHYGKLICGSWPKNDEECSAVLSEAQAVALFGALDCLGRTINIDNMERKIVGVYRQQFSLPIMLSHPEGAAAYVMTADKNDSMLAVHLTADYDELLAASEVKQQLFGNGVNQFGIENLALISAQLKGHIQMMLATIPALYLFTVLRLLKKKRRESIEKIRIASQKDYFPNNLKYIARPFCLWVLTWLPEIVGLCICTWLFVVGIVVDPQFLPPVVTSSAILNTIKAFLININSHRFSTTAYCNVLLWIQTLSKWCFVIMLFLYLFGTKEFNNHAQD